MTTQTTTKNLIRLFAAVALAALAAWGIAQVPVRDFDHVKTGFPLTGAHAKERCESCHVNGVFKGTPRDCATCHAAGSLLSRTNIVKPLRHFPTTQACDACHNTQTFTGARFTHGGVLPGSCQSCHNGSFATGKPAGHLQTQASCDSCHRTAAWVPATGFDHASVTPGTCATCHNGSRAVGKPAMHMPVGTQSCDACHTTTRWRPSSWNHTQVPVTNQCSTCHSGAFPPADGRSPGHIPYQLITGTPITNCDTCHRSGYAAWTPARFHSSVTVSTQCATCHTGSFPPAVGKPNTSTHVGVTACEGCHRSTASWLTVTFAHSPANAVGTGTCDTCHNGSVARGKSPTHVPVTTGVARCDSCHRSQSSFATAVTMNHSVVTTTACKTCHNGSYLSEGVTGALAKPANHIPEATQLLNGGALDCNACHTSTTSWASMRMNHNASLGNGAGWCKGCHATGTSFLGSMEKKSLTHQQRTPAPTDCSQSGCHRPLGNKGAAYSKWD